MSRAVVERRGLAMFMAVVALGLYALRGEPVTPDAPPPLATVGAVESEENAARVASIAEARLRLFTTGNGGDRLVLDGDEITAVLRHSIPGVIPSGVSSPIVSFLDGKVRVTARIAAAAFPGTPVLAPVLDVLPDTIDVELRGHVLRDGRTVALRIDRVSAGRVPIPRAVVAAVVASLGVPGPTDSHPTLRLAWPDGVTAMNVRGDRLVLERAVASFAEPAGEGP